MRTPLRGVTALQGGRSNQSLLLDYGPRALVVRIDGLNPADNALDRRAEFEIMQSAARAGIAPRPRWVDPQRGILVYDFAGSRTRQRPPRTAPSTVHELAALLRAIHSLPTHARTLALNQQVAHYQQQLSASCQHHPLLIELGPAARHHCRLLLSGGEAAVLCHNDLLPSNLVRHRGCLLALDWEYAATGSRWFDLAACSALENRRTALQLQNAYLQRRATAHERAALLSARFVHHYLWLLWERANAVSHDPRMSLPGLRLTLEEAEAGWLDTQLPLGNPLASASAAGAVVH